MVQFVLQAYVPSLYQSLGLFLPLIVVNCIILGKSGSIRKQEQHHRFRTGRCWNGSWIHSDTGPDGCHQRTSGCRNSPGLHRIRFLVHTNRILQSGSGRILRIRIPDCNAESGYKGQSTEETVKSFSCGGCPMYNSCNLAEVKDGSRSSGTLSRKELKHNG